MSKIKSLPLDVKLLRLGLDYAQKRAQNEDISTLCANLDSLKRIEDKFYKNLQFLHAKVHENPPRIELKYGRTWAEILHCDMKINKIIKNEIFQVDPDLSPEVNKVNGLTTLDLLSVTLFRQNLHKALVDVMRMLFGRVEVDFHPLFAVASLEPARRYMRYNEDWFRGFPEGCVQPLQLAARIRALGEVVAIVDVCVENNHTQGGLCQFQHF